MRFFHQKFLIIFSFLCIVSSVLYAILVHSFVSEDDSLLYEEPSFNGLPCSLSLFNFEKIACWHDIPDTLHYDVFTTSVLRNLNHNVSNEAQRLTLPDLPFPIRFNGWSGVDETMIFVFSALNSNKTFIGTVGDSFENPSFAIISFDLKTVQAGSNAYSVPIVTILDKELDRLITLVPASCNESLNAIN